MNRIPLLLTLAIVMIAGSVDALAQSSDDWNREGVKYLQSEDNNSAIQAFNKSIALNPKNKDPYFGRAMAYVGLQRSSEAIRDLTSFIALDPSIGNAYYLRGQLYRHGGKNQLAVRDYISAARLGHEPAQEVLTKSGITW